MNSRNHLRVGVLSPGEFDEWTKLVEDASAGSAYSLPAYLDAFANATGGRFEVVAARRGDELVGGIAVYERQTPLGNFVAPRLLLYYNGFVLRDYETRYPSDRVGRRYQTVAKLAEELAQRRYLRLDLATRSPVGDMRPLIATGWEVSPSYTYVVPLDNLAQQWHRVDQNLRRLVERGRMQGLAIVADEDFDSFYQLHVGTATRKRGFVYLPEGAFRSLYETLREQSLARLFHARLPDGRIAASQLVLLGHRVTHTVAAAADPEHQSTGANAFLRWSVFEALASEGFAANDLTDAMVPSVARFKAQLGGELTTYYVARRPATAKYRMQMSAYRRVVQPLLRFGGASRREAQNWSRRQTKKGSPTSTPIRARSVAERASAQSSRDTVKP